MISASNITLGLPEDKPLLKKLDGDFAKRILDSMSGSQLYPRVHQSPKFLGQLISDDQIVIYYEPDPKAKDKKAPMFSTTGKDTLVVGIVDKDIPVTLEGMLAKQSRLTSPRGSGVVLMRPSRAPSEAKSPAYLSIPPRAASKVISPSTSPTYSAQKRPLRSPSEMEVPACLKELADFKTSKDHLKIREIHKQIMKTSAMLRIDQCQVPGPRHARNSSVPIRRQFVT